MSVLQLNTASPPLTSGQPQPIAPNAGTGPPTFYTAYRAINEAMRDAGYLGSGTDATSEELARFMPRLNELANWWQTKGIKLWLEEDLSFTPVQGYNCYQFGTQVTNTVPGTYFLVAKPLRFKEGFWVDNTGNSRPLLPILSRNEWDYLSTRTQQGAISQFYVDKQQNYTNLFLWLTPDLYSATQGQVHVVAQAQVNNVISLTDAMNLPIEWFMALHWNLASQIDQGQPKEVQDKNTQMAEMTLTALEDWDVEDASVTFQPDYRLQYQQNSFR